MRSVRNSFVLVALGAMVLLAAPARAAQQVKQGTAPRIQSVEGVDSFKAYCSVCHGLDAKGVSGPDLTAVSGRFSVRDLLVDGSRK